MKLSTIIFLSLLPVGLLAQNPAEMKTTFRGKYFNKSVYTPSNIPDFSGSRDRLPQPVLPARQDYLKLYWKAWELAFTHFKRPPAGSPFVSDFIDEAFAPQIFQWDTVFMIEFARYAHHLFPSIRSFDNFYVRQWEDGFIHREIRESDGFEFWFEGSLHAVNPPLFAWSELEYQKLNGRSGRIKDVFPVLVKYAEWLEKNRKKQGTAHGLYWNTGLGSGMDNTPRSGSGWVDMSAQMVLMYDALSAMASVLNLQQDRQAFRAKADSISGVINQLMWNEKDRIYYDLDDAGQQVKVKTIAGFWPMLAGVASDHQVEKMLDELRNPQTFWRPIPFPSLAQNHPAYEADGKYWLGSVWAPTNVMVLKGLDRYPQVRATREFAAHAAGAYLDGMVKVFESTGTIWENYSAEQVTRGGWSKPDFVGWSGCGPIQLLIENVIGIKPDALNRTVTWTLTRIDEHGVNAIPFGEGSLSLVADRRVSVTAMPVVRVEATEPFTLILMDANQTWKIPVLAGTTRLSPGEYQQWLVPESKSN